MSFNILAKIIGNLVLIRGGRHYARMRHYFLLIVCLVTTFCALGQVPEVDLNFHGREPLFDINYHGTHGGIALKEGNPITISFLPPAERADAKLIAGLYYSTYSEQAKLSYRLQESTCPVDLGLPTMIEARAFDCEMHLHAASGRAVWAWQINDLHPELTGKILLKANSDIDKLNQLNKEDQLKFYAENYAINPMDISSLNYHAQFNSKAGSNHPFRCKGAEGQKLVSKTASLVAIQPEFTFNNRITDISMAMAGTVFPVIYSPIVSEKFVDDRTYDYYFSRSINYGPSTFSLIGEKLRFIYRYNGPDSNQVNKQCYLSFMLRENLANSFNAFGATEVIKGRDFIIKSHPMIYHRDNPFITDDHQSFETFYRMIRDLISDFGLLNLGAK